jgi:predicted lipoprotein with Yx(FWY)xxD motif
MKGRILILVVIVVAATALTSASAATTRTSVSSESSKLGRILVDAHGRTLYLFEKDKRGRSSCSGACAAYWPPLVTRGKPLASGGVKQSLLGFIRRANGTRQVTYAGHPLYRYAGDAHAGSTAGEGLQDFGAGWYVVSRAGKKIERDGS